MPSMELDDDHGNGDGLKMVINAPTWKRRKRKTKTQDDQGKCINRVFISPLKTP
jgi:hypothetical protein